MKSRRSTRLFQGCLAVLALSSLASSAIAANDVAVTGKLSTLGLGLELTMPVNDNFNGRVGFNAFNYDFSASEGGVDYDAELRLQSVSLLGDWFPVAGSGFRVSAGLLYNNNKFDMTAKPSAGATYTVGGGTYNAALAGSLDAKVTFDKIAPYIGIGFGNAVEKAKTWGFSMDLGVVYQNSPKATLVNSNCTLPGTGCADLATDIAAEQVELQDAMDDYKWYPVISIGASYKF